MTIESFKYYKAKVNYHRTDDLAEYAPDNGTIVLVSANWIADEDETFSGDWMFRMSRYFGNIPQRDLQILQEVSYEDFENDRKLGLIKTI